VTPLSHKYFDTYYQNSDIDVMCTKTKIIPFLDEVYKLYTILKQNIIKFNPDVSDIKIKIVPNKISSIIVTPTYIKLVMEKVLKKSTEEIKAKFNKQYIKQYFFTQCVLKKFINNEDLRKKFPKLNPLYEAFFEMPNIDDLNVYLVDDNSSYLRKNYEPDVNEVCLYLNDINKEQGLPIVSDDLNILVMKMSESIKFKIESPYIPRNIEVFKIKYEEIFSCVARFHLPCVRGYYDGDEVYILPTCITALMTHINMDYKWFAGVRDPIEIIIKYFLRNYGTILNSIELHHMFEYIKRTEKWRNLFDVSKRGNIFGFKEVSNNMYSFNKDSTYNDVSHIKYIKTMDDLIKVYKDEYGYDQNQYNIKILNFKTMDPDGTLIPHMRWLSDGFFDERSKGF